MKLLSLIALTLTLTAPAFAANAKRAVASDSLKCGGSEPFWSATVSLNQNKGVANFSFEPADGKKVAIKGAKILMTNNDGNVKFLRGWGGGKAFFATLTDMGARQTPCTGEGEGPENEYPFEIAFIANDQPFVGCCR